MGNEASVRFVRYVGPTDGTQAFLTAGGSQLDGNPTTRGKRLTRWLRLQVLRVIRENSTPERSGLGFALGSFIGVFPSFLIGSPLAFFLAGRFGWNRAAAVAGTFLMNPVTAPIFYWVSTWLGLEVLGRDTEMVQINGLVKQMPHFGLVFLIGNTAKVPSAAAPGPIEYTLKRVARRSKGNQKLLLLNMRPAARAAWERGAMKGNSASFR